MSNIFSELKRRNVFRVAAAYLVIGWLLAQVVGLAADSFDAPAWVMKMFITLLAIGFIPAVLFSWAYELTPEGLKKDSDVSRDESIANHTAKKLDYITIVAAVGVLCLFVYQQMNPTPSSVISEKSGIYVENIDSDSRLRGNDENGEGIERTNNDNVASISKVLTVKEVDSIAVLPFVNMSSDKDQEYFADGISEEILNALVKATGLRVAGRTSSFSFKGKDKTIKEIGEALQVSNVLEGSVRKQGNKVRITAQLIKADDGFHLWSETYDGNLDNIFDLQENISRKVTDELKVILNLNTDERLANKMTDDIEAYDLFLRGRELVAKRINDNIPKGIALLNQAVKRDPEFAEAWAVLAEAEAVGYGYYEVDQFQSSIRANAHAHKAISLNSQLALPHAVLGLLKSDQNKIIEALDDLNQALKVEPNNVLVNRWLGVNYNRLGRGDLGMPFLKKAYRLDPLSSINAYNLASSHFLLGEQEDAIKMFKISGKLRDQLMFDTTFVYEYQGKYQQAREHFKKLYQMDIESEIEDLFSEEEMVILNKAMFDGTEPEKTAAKELNGVYIKNTYDKFHWQIRPTLAIGNIDMAYEILEKKPDFFINFSTDLMWFPNQAIKDFRADPRFIKLLQKHKYPEAWQVIGWPELCQPNEGTDGSDGQFTCQ